MRNAIVFAADRKLFPVAAYQAQCLASLGMPDTIDVIIASESAEDLRLATESGIPFRPLHLDAAATAGMQTGGWSHYSLAAYYRVFLPTLLRKEYDRLLYLDVDIHIHNTTLFRLFEIEMGENAIAAVRDLIPFRRDRETRQELAYTTRNRARKYLNSGVLLINLDQYLTERLQERVLATNLAKRLWLVDQSAFNIVLDGDWLELSPAFNFPIELWSTFARDVCDPVVVHFIGPNKPWLGPRFAYNHPARAALEAFIRTSPWKTFLSGFYSFSDAWADLQKRTAPRAIPEVTIPANLDMAAFVQHLRTTQFADIEQRLISLHVDRIPRRV